ncbi:MAG: hypothetical protein AB7L13_17075 [Acidimicrobiia bacterium]
MNDRYRHNGRLLALAFGVVLTPIFTCGAPTPAPPRPAVTVYASFDADDEGWTALFADHPDDLGSADYDLVAHWATIPDVGGGGLRLAGTNRSDDLWMSIVRPVERLQLGCYALSGTVSIATDVPPGMIGAGGAPGEDVTVKAGASTESPGTYVDPLGFRRLTVDKGEQANDGQQAVAIGHLASAATDGSRFVVKTMSVPDGVRVRVGPEGVAWVIIGSDSGYEGRSDFYVDEVALTLTPC